MYFYNNPLAFRCILKYEGNQKQAHICNPFVARAYWDEH